MRFKILPIPIILKIKNNVIALEITIPFPVLSNKIESVKSIARKKLVIKRLTKRLLSGLVKKSSDKNDNQSKIVITVLSFDFFEASICLFGFIPFSF